MKKQSTLALLFFLTINQIAFSQSMETTAYRDVTIPFIEVNTAFYDFGFPIQSNMLSSSSLTPPDHLYLKSDYGHRYLSHRSTKTDNHGGFDYWPDHFYNGVQYDENNKIDIISMCDGTISEIINGTDAQMELIPEGRSVQVKCTQQSQVFNSDIKINYRHLADLGSIPASAEGEPVNSININKGDIIGKIGESGTTSNVHLHLSMETDHPDHGNAHLNTARLFNPNVHSNIIEPLTEASITLLHTWDNNALFRIVWSYNQTINRFEFQNEAFSVVFDKEEAYEVGSATRDDHDAIDGIQVFAYQFNGKQTASARYENEKDNIPPIYPASPQRDDDLATYVFPHYPITENTISHVYDFIIEDLPNGFQNEDFIVKLSDVWGYTVEGNLSTLSTSNVDTNNGIHVFPNPAKDEVNLRFHNAIPETVFLFDVSGKQINQYQVQEDSLKIDLQSYTSGIYFLKATNQARTQTIRIIKM